MNEGKLFQSGVWCSRYRQKGTWHGPHEISLSFDPETFQVKGSGRDDVGFYTVNGRFSKETYRIAVTKCYVLDTSNPSQNLGHCVPIQVAYNKRNEEFEGKWYVDTEEYSGEGVFKLKFESSYV